MIDPKELRIGNQVNCTVHLPIGYNRPPLFVSKITAIKGDFVETDEGMHKYKDIAPIALTEIILIRSGGGKVSDNEITFKSDGRNGNTEDLSFKIAEGKFYLRGNDSKELSVAIEWVHQFQNIFYDLRGYEIDLVMS